MAKKWTDPTGEITLWEESTLRGDVTYYLESPAGKKTYSSRAARKAAFMKLIEPNKAIKLTEADKKIQSQLKLGGYFKDPSTGVDTVDSLRAGGNFIPERFKKPKTPETLERQKGVLEKSFQRLTDKKTDADANMDTWTDKDQRDYDYYEGRLDEVSKQLGLDTPTTPKGDGDYSPGAPKEKKMGYWERAEKDTWIKNRTNQIVAEGKLMFNQAKVQAEEDWEKEHNKKDPAKLFTK